MSLVKTSLLSGISVGVKLASSLVLNKVLAIYVGPAGYAMIGQFQNVVSILVSLAGGLMATGVTKSTAQHFDDEDKQHKVWQTAIRFSLTASILAGLVLLIAGRRLSEFLLHRADMPSIFLWLVLALPAIAANNLLLAILNGKKEVGVYVTANIIGSLFNLIVISTLAYYFGIYGALVAFCISPAIALLSTAALMARRSWFKPHLLWGKMDASSTGELTGYAIMGLTSALVVPVSHMLIRDYLASRLGLPAAGYWQASWKISEIYLMLITTTLSVYYLPRLSEIRTAHELRTEIVKVYSFVIPIVVTGAITIYMIRDIIIGLLFTEDFSPMRELFAWQLTGDVIKIGAWVLAFVLIGRAMTKAYVITEVVFSINFFLLSRCLVEIFEINGVAMAHAINYCLYLIVVTYLVKAEMKLMNNCTLASTKIIY
jgi:PST family polysaccharide transporter